MDFDDPSPELCPPTGLVDERPSCPPFPRAEQVRWMGTHYESPGGSLVEGDPLRVQGSCTCRPCHPIGLVLVVGTQQPHYRDLFAAYPALVNSPLDVTVPLAVERGVRRPGRTGFDYRCAERIAALKPFRSLVAAAVEFFCRTHLVVICCRHGRHRSGVHALTRPSRPRSQLRGFCPSYGLA